MMRKLLTLALLLVSVPAAQAATYYVSQAGADTNNGTSTSTAWLHAPGMVGCSGTCASTTPAAGDRIIFRGGDTWGPSNFTWNWQWGGSSGNVIYIGVDVNFFMGGSWTRPIFDAQSTMMSGGNRFIFFSNSSSWVTIDNFEMRNMFWNVNQSFGQTVMININAGTNVTIQNCYLHGWTHGGSATDQMTVIQGTTGSPFNVGSLILNCIVDGGSGQNSGQGTYAFPNIRNSIWRNMVSALLINGHGEISGNDISNIISSFSGNHPNSMEALGGDGIFYIHDNVIHDTSTGETMFLGNSGETDYVWNNVMYNLGGNEPELVQQATAPSASTFWNNTIVPPAGHFCLRLGHVATIPKVEFRNNHCITTNSAAVDPSLISNTTVYTADHNILQTPSVANGQGYNANQAFAWSPTASGNSTVGAGANLTGNCSGGNANLCIDTGYAVTENTTTHTVTFPRRAQISRPASGAWDTGAYLLTACTTPSATGLSLNPSTVVGGNSSTGTVTLSCAPSSNTAVSLSSNNTAAATVPSTVTVGAGTTSASFSVTTLGVSSSTNVTITATLNGSSTAALTVNPAGVLSVALNPTTVVGGNSSTGTVTLNGAAPTGGVSVSLSSNNGAATVPSSVTVASQATSATFTVTTTSVGSTQTATITATLNGSANAVLTITPAVSIVSVTVNPSTVVGGVQNSTGTVTISQAAPSGGTTVSLSSDTPAAGSVPSSVTVAQGQTAATFTVTTGVVAVSTNVTITATLGGSATAVLTVLPPQPTALIKGAVAAGVKIQ